MKTFTNPVAHVYREANSCADKLARMGADPILDYLFLYDSLLVVVDLLAIDKAGLVCNRLLVP